MNRRSFLSATIPAWATAAPAPRKHPNVVLVVMDDFGIGQFAPLAKNIETKQFDPAFVEYLKKREQPYTPAQALDFSRRAMPTMISLARGGVLFSHAFATSNLCAPARNGILTGCLPNRFGLYQNTDVERTGFVPGTVLAARLKQAGYTTGFVGKWHAGPRLEGAIRQGVLKKHGVTQAQFAGLPKEKKREIDQEYQSSGASGSVMPSHHPLNNGFDYYFGYNTWQSPFYDAANIWENWNYAGVQKRYNTELFTDKAIDFIRGAKRAGKPFFVQVSYHAVHGPLKPQAPRRYFDKFPSESYELSNFYAHVNAVDEGVAALRTEIGDEWDNTLFLFSGDNGAPLDVASPLPGNAPYAGHKGTFWQGGIRIPMLMHWPAGMRGGQVRNEMVSAMDMMPTALDAAGVPLPPDLDGRSVLPLTSGKTAKLHDHLVWAGIHARSWGFHRETVIGANPEKRREESPGAWVATDGRFVLRFVTSTPKGLFKEAPDGAPAHYEMFDLSEDPTESKNIYDKVPQIAAQLKAVFFRQARTLPPPTVWRKDRWREMMPPDNIHLKQNAP